LAISSRARDNGGGSERRLARSSRRRASSSDGDGAGRGGRSRIHGLQFSSDEGRPIRLDSQALEIRHCLFARGGGVDAEDHAFAAVFAVALFAVEPFSLLAPNPLIPTSSPGKWCLDLQSGSIASTVMFQVTPALPSGLGMNPESMPPAIFLHGSAKVDCVAVWFFCMNSKTTMSPMAAVMDSGL
jgi:hypothetical protein